MHRIGIIGGSGLYDIEGIKDVQKVEIDTPFGRPSDAFTIGKLAGREVVFLPRHGAGHTIIPTQLPFRANIYGMKKLGVEQIIAVSAVGSMKEEIRPLDIVIPDQFFDRTKARVDTFFGDGVVAHVGMADPVCAGVAEALHRATKQVGVRVHKGGTYVCMEGPQFSTRAESLVYRQLGVSVIGMTNLQEAKLAREAEICYATLALSTDYDCWHVGEEAVTVEMIIANLKKNIENAKKIIKVTIPELPKVRNCPCSTALKNAIITRPEAIPQERRKELELIIGKYLG
ncbi:MAG: methylthioadenosine phosphorylase [Planctomycetes bacterium RIFCSPHIGHO2_12_FULL_52_36]|nr:MAG: methylthioadenosine phosphorylase [Planctomycetes bacterium RIFCSPHIGHO2_02_FULL_52_58]OHB94201.1 MAG: methylthioadenosine phosphorylase [Planctomycetes bacterium RIFCSPHIGHO2_12_FULL_52_36]